MNISSIGSIGSTGRMTGLSDIKKPVSSKEDNGFVNSIKDSIESVNKSQEEANSDIKKALSGEEISVAEVMISTLKAEVSMQLTLQIRNKIIEAYNEITRMQV